MVLGNDRKNEEVTQTADLGLDGEPLPLHAHVAYFWETDQEFADAVGFLEVGLRGTDHCVIFGHEEANQAVCRILRERGFDVEALQVGRRLSVLGGGASGEAILQMIADDFAQAIADGAPLIRLLGNIGWYKDAWPDETDLLAFEAKVTDATKQFPCVVVCLYDMRSLPGLIVHQGGFETHPLVVHEDSARQNPYYVPTDVFLKRLEATATGIAEHRRAGELLRAITEGTAAVTGRDFFRSLVRHLARALRVRYAFIAECTDETQNRVRTLAFWTGEDFGDNVTYLIRGTPCEKVIGGEVCWYPERLQMLFPEDKDLVILQAESYLGVPLPGSSGDILGHLVVMDHKPMATRPRDVSILRIFAARAGVELERQRAGEALRKSEERFRTLFASAPIGITINNAEGRFIQVNQAFQDMLGYSEDELWGMSFKEITMVEDLAESKQVFAELVAGTRKEFRIEKRYRRKDEGIMWASTNCSAVRDADGKFVYTFAMVEDITERKRAEQALREALAEVEQLKNRLQAENIYLQEEIKTEYNFEEIVGASTAMKRVFQNIERVAGTDTTVLITGETGTGKELVARAIHNLSRRKDRPLITVNCAALPSGLIESELFGHEKGAFTGAVARKKGRFELADGGTIFLDEIGELPLETQIKLLRVLQEREFERVGGSQTLQVDVRVLAATNRDLEAQVKLGAFRADLFYRLNIFPIPLPPLRERSDDIALLTHYFVGKFSRRMGKKIDRVSREALNKLMAYHWSGNVRELANLIERAVILCDGGILQPHHIGLSHQPSVSDTAISTLEEMERSQILKALEETNWVVGGPSGAAQLLGLNRTTLLARMKKLGIEKPNPH
jgi:PAS domain S-box-containing protein